MFTHKKIFAALLLAPLFVGCTVEDGDDDGAGTDTDATATADPTGDPTTDPTADPTTDPTADPTTDPTAETTDPTATDPTATGDTSDGGTTAAETDTGGGGMFCQAMCAEAVDCCNGAPNCPGDYPLNYECVDGLCESGGCADDMDCMIIMGTSCLEVNGFPLCVPTCESDDDCLTEFGETCTGMADSGEMICEIEPVGCKSDEDCFGFGTCDVATGVCSCADTTECPKGYECVGG